VILLTAPDNNLSTLFVAVRSHVVCKTFVKSMRTIIVDRYLIRFIKKTAKKPSLGEINNKTAY
jgi:hypothetical protein